MASCSLLTLNSRPFLPQSWSENQLALLSHCYNPSIWETEAERSRKSSSPVRTHKTFSQKWKTKGLETCFKFLIWNQLWFNSHGTRSSFGHVHAFPYEPTLRSLPRIIIEVKHTQPNIKGGLYVRKQLAAYLISTHKLNTQPHLNEIKIGTLQSA